MLCKVCNTRVSPGSSACPNCGSHSILVPLSADLDSATKLPLPGLEGDARHEGMDEAAAVAPSEPLEVDVEVLTPAQERWCARCQVAKERLSAYWMLLVWAFALLGLSEWCVGARGLRLGKDEL